MKLLFNNWIPYCEKNAMLRKRKIRISRNLFTFTEVTLSLTFENSFVEYKNRHMFYRPCILIIIQIVNCHLVQRFLSKQYCVPPQLMCSVCSLKTIRLIIVMYTCQSLKYLFGLLSSWSCPIDF